MTERLCATCGHVEYWHGEGSVPLPHPKSGPACARCMEQNDVDPWHDFSPPEAAPSTDEGEARMPVRRCAVCEGEITASSGEWWIPEQILHVEGGEPHRAVYVRDWQAAAIRVPLEERIRELEVHGSALAAVDGERIEYLEAEVERLREALRTIASWGVDPANRAGELSLIFQYAERALATPPSSTEGTDG